MEIYCYGDCTPGCVYQDDNGNCTLDCKKSDEQNDDLTQEGR